MEGTISVFLPGSHSFDVNIKKDVSWRWRS